MGAQLDGRDGPAVHDSIGTARTAMRYRPINYGDQHADEKQEFVAIEQMRCIL